MFKSAEKFLLCLFLLSFPAQAEVLTGVGANSEDSAQLQARAWITEHIGIDFAVPAGAKPTVTPMIRGERGQSVVPYIGAELNPEGELPVSQLVAGLEIRLTKSWRLAAQVEAGSKKTATTVAVLVDLDQLRQPGTPARKPVQTEIPADQEDLLLLARLISAEARGEPYLGQVAVGGVVFNRMESPLFPNSIRAVILQPGQFSPVSNGSINMAPTESAIRAARAAMTGQDPSGGALYFYNPKLSSPTGRRYMEQKTVTVRIGNHIFVK